MDIPRMGLPDHLASRLSMAEQHELLNRRRGTAAAGCWPVPPRSRARRSPAASVRRPRRHRHRLAAAGRGARQARRAVRPAPGLGRQPAHRRCASAGRCRHLVTKPFLRIGDVALEPRPADPGRDPRAALRGARRDRPGRPVLRARRARRPAARPDVLLRGRPRRLRPGRPDRVRPGRLVHHRALAPPGRRRRSPSPPSATRASATTRWPTTAWSPPRTRSSTCTPATSATPTPSGRQAGQRTGSSGTDLYNPRTWDQFLAQTEPIAAIGAVDGLASATTTWRRCTRRTATAASAPAGTSRTTARRSPTGVYSFIYGNVGGGLAGRQRRLVRDPGQPRLHRRHADRVAGQPARSSCASSRTSTSSWSSSTTARTRPPASTPPRAACATSGCRCSTSTSVDLVINGHNHIYERADVLKRRRGQEDADRRHRPPGDRRHHLRHRRGRGPRPVQLPGARLVRRPRSTTSTTVRSYVSAAGGGKVTEHVTLVPGPLHRLLVPRRGRRTGRRAAARPPSPCAR